MNGLVQVDGVALEPPTTDKPLERVFRIKIFLTRPDENRLEVQLPGVPKEESDSGPYLVACENPLPEKRTASRTGASAAGSSPQTGSDSSHGSAIETPSPRRKDRRERK